MKQVTSVGQWFKLLAIAAPLSPAICFAQSPTFSVQVLDNISGGTVIAVKGINNAGEAVGGAGGGTSICSNECAVIWQGGTPTVLGVVPGSSGVQTVALSVNNAGLVAGVMVTMANESSQAVIWNNGAPTLLPAPSPQYPSTGAASVNDAGQVAGNASSNTKSVAIVWNGLTPTVLSPVSGFTGNAYASGINSQGLAVGTDYFSGSEGGEAVVWHGTTATPLPEIKPNQGTRAGKALAVNGEGLVVGTATNAAGEAEAAAWDGHTVTSMGVLGTGNRSTGTAVNNRGIIVGQSATVDYTVFHAALWTRVGAAPQDLNSLIGATAAAEYVLTGAMGINDSCAIVANGYNKKTGVLEAFLLTLINPSICVNGL
jgi:hypothetical protein